MEIISQNDGILCNHEVFDIVNERRAKSSVESRSNVELQNRETMERKLVKYMSARCTHSIPQESVAAFINDTRLNNIYLTKAEIMVIFNHLPTQVVEIHLIVEECVERLSEDDIDYILGCVSKYCGKVTNSKST
jgi:DNA-directed RNA polymerase subunit F